jgi:hypothetical protein
MTYIISLHQPLAATLQEPAHFRVRLERFVFFPIEQRELRLVLFRGSATFPSGISGDKTMTMDSLAPISASVLPISVKIHSSLSRLMMRFVVYHISFRVHLDVSNGGSWWEADLASVRDSV